MPINIFGASAKIAIDLDRPKGPYYPGDVIHAAITLDCEKECKISGFRAGLLAWELSIREADEDNPRTKRETMSEMVTEKMLLDETTLAAGFHGTYQVDLPIPGDAFPSYTSSSLHGGWHLKATLDRQSKKDVDAAFYVPVVVPPPRERAQAGEVGEASHPDVADMKLWLPSLEWVEGETIEGKLRIRTGKGFDASEVRLQLKRREDVHAPRYKTYTVYTLDRVVLAGKTRFQPGQEADLPFHFPTSVMGCPTRHTASSTVIYTLQAVVSRRLAKDYTVGAEIWLYNGRRAG